MINILDIGLGAQRKSLELNEKARAKVVPIPTPLNVATLKAQGKKIVHKPKAFDDDDLPPAAA